MVRYCGFEGGMDVDMSHGCSGTAVCQGRFRCGRAFRIPELRLVGIARWLGEEGLCRRG